MKCPRCGFDGAYHYLTLVKGFGERDGFRFGFCPHKRGGCAHSWRLS